MLSLLTLERKQKIILIYFEFAYFPFFNSFGIETTNTFIHSHSSLKTIPDSRPKWAKCVLVSDQIGAKTLSDGAAHTYMAYIREYPPPGHFREEWDKPARQQVISETLIWRNHIYDVMSLRPTFVAPFSDRDHLGFKSIYVATLRLSLTDIKSRRPSLSICETKVAERGTRLFQSHFVISVFHWNCTQKEFVLWVWIVPGDVSDDQRPIDCW